MKEQEHEKFMRIAIALAEKNVAENLGGPFGAVIVKDGRVVSKSGNRVTTTNDPTAHAEVSAIRLACKKLKTYDLSGCVIYTSCEPCPMCLSAIYWARIDNIYQGNTKSDAAEIGFDDQFIYEELEKPVHARKVKVTELLRDEAQEAFKLWEDSGRKIHY